MTTNHLVTEGNRDLFHLDKTISVSNDTVTACCFYSSKSHRASTICAVNCIVMGTIHGDVHLTDISGGFYNRTFENVHTTAIEDMVIVDNQLISLASDGLVLTPLNNACDSKNLLAANTTSFTVTKVDEVTTIVATTMTGDVVFIALNTPSKRSVLAGVLESGYKVTSDCDDFLYFTSMYNNSIEVWDDTLDVCKLHPDDCVLGADSKGGTLVCSTSNNDLLVICDEEQFTLTGHVHVPIGVQFLETNRRYIMSYSQRDVIISDIIRGTTMKRLDFDPNEKIKNVDYTCDQLSVNTGGEIHIYNVKHIT